MKKIEKKSVKTPNPEWYQMITKPLLNMKKKKLDWVEVLRFNKKIHRKARKNKIKPKIITSIGSKLFYVRHAGDFLFGYLGKKNEAKETFLTITNFIKSNLRLNCVGFKLKSAHSDIMKYLGFCLRYPKKSENLSKSRPVQKFEKLKNRLTVRKAIENSRYLKTLEWAGKKFYRNIVEQIIRQPNQTLAKQGINLKNILTHWGQRDGIIYLWNALKQKIPTLDVLRDDLLHPITDPYYQTANNFRERRYNEFIQEWSDAANSLAQTDLNKEIKEFLPQEINKVYETSRKHFLEQVKIIYENRTRCSLIQNIFSKHNSNSMAKLIKKVGLATLNHSVRIYINVENVLNKFKKQGIVNKKNHPICCNKICLLEDYQIINQIASKAYRIINFYQCVDNLWEVKSLVNYTLRFSLAATLARKYKTSIKKVFAKYGPNFNIKTSSKGKIIKIANFPSKIQVNTLKHKFNIKAINYN